MYTVAIVDDDQVQAAALAQQIRMSSYAQDIANIVLMAPGDLASGGLSGIDILFVGVRLGEGPTGIDLVDSFVPRGGSVQVIYVSDHLEYALQAYRTEHTWFLAKPVEPDSLNAALARAIENLGCMQRKPILVRARGSLVQLVPQDIMYVESERRRAHIHLSGSEVVAYAKLSDLERALPPQFIRCHKSFLVNMDYISRLRARDALLTTGDVLPVSQRCRKTLQECFMRYVGRLV